MVYIHTDRAVANSATLAVVASQGKSSLNSLNRMVV